MPAANPEIPSRDDKPFTLAETNWTPSTTELTARLFSVFDEISVTHVEAERFLAQLPEAVQTEKLNTFYIKLVRLIGNSNYTSAFDRLAQVCNEAVKDPIKLYILEQLAERAPNEGASIWDRARLSNIQHAVRTILAACPDNLDAWHYLGELVKNSLRVKRLLRENDFRPHLIELLRSDNEASAQSAAHLLSGYGVDSTPYAGDAKAGELDQQLKQQVLETYRRVFDLHLGFETLAVEARRVATNSKSLQQRLGEDLCDSVDLYLQSSDNLFPGKGVVYNGVRLGRVFADDAADRRSPFDVYRQRFAWATDDIYPLSRARFAEFRGFIAIIPPADNEGYQLDGLPCSIIIYNDHFINPLGIAALVVPTEFILEAITAYSSSKIRPPRELQPLALFERGGKEKLPILNLGLVSNLAGMANAYPAGSVPYFGWENEVSAAKYMSGHTRDVAGHYHKMYFNFSITKPSLGTDRELLRRLALGHDSVYELTRRCLNLYDLFRITRAFWHKNLTADATSTFKPNFEAGFEDQFGPSHSEARMLQEVYSWNARRNQGTLDRRDFPILALGSALDYSSKVESPFMLDTFDLTLTLRSGEKILFPKEIGDSAMNANELWALHVRPLLGPTLSDIRFYRRDWLIQT